MRSLWVKGRFEGAKEGLEIVLNKSAPWARRSKRAEKGNTERRATANERLETSLASKRAALEEKVFSPKNHIDINNLYFI